MNRRILSLAVILLSSLALGLSTRPSPGQEAAGTRRKVEKTDAEWAKRLTRDQYLVTRQKATEPPFSGKYATSHARGTYTCVCCGAELFGSQAKFESGTGWPSFFRPVDPKKIETAADNHLGESRVEVMCNACGAHLGHVFNDGPPPTGLRYCINSVALKLVPKAASGDEPAGSKMSGKASGKSKAGAKSRARRVRGRGTPGDQPGEPTPARPETKPAEAKEEGTTQP